MSLTFPMSEVVKSASVATGFSRSFCETRNCCIASHCAAVMSPHFTEASLWSFHSFAVEERTCFDRFIASSGLDVRLDDRIDHAAVPAQAQLAMYRVVQESLTNVSRHAAGVTGVDVTLERAGETYVVAVRDDGRGETANESGGRGLLGMRERAELLGGHLSAGPAEGGGFEVRMEIPA